MTLCMGFASSILCIYNKYTAALSEKYMEGFLYKRFEGFFKVNMYVS